MKVKFPPKVTTADIKKGVHKQHDGESHLIPLTRYQNDRTIRGDNWVGCCECGFRHLLSYEVFYSNADGRFYLNIRAYADERTRPRTKKK